MKRKILYLVIIMGCITSQLKAQQSPLFGFTSQFLPVVNPSLSKDKTPLNISLAGRKYWTGIPDSPEAFIGTLGISPADYKSAFGAYIWRENAPLISKQIMGFNYAYGVKGMDEAVNLRLGMGLDFISVNSSTNSVLVSDYNDPYYTALFNNNRSSIDLRLGATLNLSDLEIGMGMQQIVRSKNRIGENIHGELNFNNASSLNGHLKYNLKPTEGIKFTPLIYWQTQKGVPLRVDLNLMAEKTGFLWGGAWIRPKAAMGIMAGFWILPEVKMGYMYEKTFFKGITNAGRSHEIMVSYSPNFKSLKREEYIKPEVVRPEVVQPEVIRVRDTIVIVKEIRITEPAPAPTPTVEPIVQKENIKESPTVLNNEKVVKGTFYVITGLYGVKENADNLCKKLEADGYRAQLILKKPQNQYYVTVGRFESEDDAHIFIRDNPNPNYTFWVKEIND